MNTRLKFFLFPIFVLSLLNVVAVNAQVTTYFDGNWKPVYSVLDAKFYRIATDMGTYFLMEDYFVSGQLYMEGTCKSLKPEVKEGLFKWYNEEGFLIEKATYVEDKKVGIQYLYYPTGEPKSEILLEGEEKKYRQIWSEEGEKMLNHGSGKGIDYDDFLKGKEYNTYEDSLLIDSYVIRDIDGLKIYYQPEQEAEPLGGFKKYMAELSREVNYPKEAKRNGIAGRVYVQVIVATNGRMIEPEVVRGIGFGCDEEAVRAVQNAKIVWQPAMSNGERQNQVLVLPVNFKLGY